MFLGGAFMGCAIVAYRGGESGWMVAWFVALSAVYFGLGRTK